MNYGFVLPSGDARTAAAALPLLELPDPIAAVSRKVLAGEAEPDVDARTLLGVLLETTVCNESSTGVVLK